MKIPLKVGIVGSNPLKINIIKEILNHQGILYEVCDKKNIQNYLCVISTEDNIEHENLILIDNELSNNFFDALSGVSKFEEKYMVNASLTEYEIQLTEKIRNCFYKQNLPFVRKWFWPDFKKACCVMTHDIDEIDRCPSKKRSKIECVKYVLSHLIFKPYGDNINTLLKLEDEKSIKSTFYFFPGYPYEKHFIKHVEKIKSKECEIGLHGSHEAASNKEKILDEKQKLQEIAEVTVSGYRQHTLTHAFRIPKTVQILNDCNLIYDISIAYNKKFGFRAGICYPYHPFDREKENKFNLLELPSPYMDWTGLFREYNKKQHLETIKKIMNTVEKYNGCIVFSFHNSYINKRLYPEIYEPFLETLNYVSEKDYWITTANECAEWWLKRENAKVDVYFENGKIIGESNIKLPLQIEYPNKIEHLQIEGEFTVT